MEVDEDLSPKEKEMFKNLSREAPCDPALGNRIIYQLRKEGLIRNGNSKSKLALRWAAILCFCIGLFLLGVFYGFKVKSRENYSYVFLLRNSRDLRSNTKDRFSEYHEWREAVEHRGIDITGEKLSASIATLGRVEESASPISGFFMLSAESDDEAFKLASESPHIKNGGAIEVRKIVHQ